MSNNDTVEKTVWEIANLFRGHGIVYPQNIAAAYLVYNVRMNGIEDCRDKSILELSSTISNESVRRFVGETTKTIKQSVYEQLNNYSTEAIKQFILCAEDRSLDKGCYSTVEGIAKLVTQILDIQEEEYVLDNCAGVCSFLQIAANAQPRANFYGVELNLDVASIGMIRAELSNQRIRIVNGNALEDNFSKMTFHKGFSEFPFGMRVRETLSGTELYNRIVKACSEVAKSTSADWAFSYRLCELVSGRAVTVMTLGDLTNTIDTPLRQSFVRIGRIQAVIKLPPKLLPQTAISVALVVFGNGEEKIHFVDASKEFVEGRRQNTLSDENLANIMHALQEDTEISKTISIQEVEYKQFSLNPAHYIEKREEVKNGVPFENVIKRMTRGAPCTANELDEISSTLPTDFQYLMLANVKNGIIDSDLPYITEIPTRLDKYCVKEGNLLLSKNGYPFKVAVAENITAKKLLANGNLFIIELDTEKVNPYYVKAYLESPQGVEQLKRIAVGASIPNIGIAQLNTVEIPLIPLEEQEKMVGYYRSLLSKIKNLRAEVEKIDNQLKSVFGWES